MTINPIYPADRSRDVPAALAWPMTGTAPSIDIGAALRTVWRRRLLVALSAVVFLLLGAVYLHLTPPRYQATAELIIDPLGLQVVKNEISPDPQTADANVAAVENEMRVIASNNVLSDVVRRENLVNDPEFVGRRSFLASLVGRLKSMAGGSSPGPAPDPRLVALQTLKKHVAILRAERSFVVDVVVRSDDPAKAARLANAIVDAYMAHSVATHAELAQRASASLEGRLGELRRQVNDAEDRVEAYKRAHDLLDAEGHLVTSQQLTEINTQLTDAKAATGAALAKLQQFESLKGGAEGGISEAVDSPTLGQLRAQAAEVERRKAVLALTLGPNHPALRNVDAELAGINAAIAAEIDRIGASLKADYDRALTNERSLQSTFDQMSTQATDASQALVKLRELEREALADRTVYETFLARSRELGEQTGVDTTNIRLISAATPPLSKSNPPTTLVLGMFLMIGLMAGIGGALVPVAFGGRRVMVPQPT